jgi:uncharacterized membrane protein
MRPERLNAFTDGVIAILITILVLELRPPSGDHLGDIAHEKGRLLAYVLTFVFVAIYWVNHHHLTQIVHWVDGRTLWANIHLLFWLSLTPVTTAAEHSNLADVHLRQHRSRGPDHSANETVPVGTATCSHKAA